jgi:bacterioferritin-associated ferredoxin
MNTSEIRAVLADLKIDQSQMSTQGFGGTCANCIAAIETLLARAAEAAVEKETHLDLIAIASAALKGDSDE